MREDLAKAWANGENNVQKRILAAGETDYSWAEKQVHDLAGKGMGVERAVNGFELCLQTLRILVTELDQVPTADEASNIWGAYDKVRLGVERWDLDLTDKQSLDRYWDFVRALTSKLKDAGIRRYLGKIFKALFAAHLRAFEVDLNHFSNGSKSLLIRRYDAQIIRTKMVANVGPKIDTKRKFETERLPGYNRPPPTEYYQTPGQHHHETFEVLT